jgi:hypothetical protein
VCATGVRARLSNWVDSLILGLAFAARVEIGDALDPDYMAAMVLVYDDVVTARGLARRHHSQMLDDWPKREGS